MASSQIRFQLKEVVVNGCINLKPNQRIPDSVDGYKPTLVGNTLLLKSTKKSDSSESVSRMFSANLEPVDATKIGLSSLASVRVKSKEGNRFLVIKRSMNLSTFPGKLSSPGGYVDPGDNDLTTTALRELKEETGEKWLDNVDIVSTHSCAILDSVPKPNIHNISIIIHIDAMIKDGFSFDDLKSSLVIQENEVEFADFWTLDRIQSNLKDFTPGYAKFFGVLEETSVGNLMWSDK